MLTTVLPSQLPASLLARRDLLPIKPHVTQLIGRYVWLEPLVLSRDAQPLFEVSNGSPISLGERSMNAYDADESIWRYMLEGPFESLATFERSLEAQVNAFNGLCLCVFDRPSRRQVGVVNLMNNYPDHLKLELGGIWYSPIVQRTKANTEAAFLMLSHTFNLGYRRLEWKSNALNERSRRAALRMGFQFEGIHEGHLIIKGCNRDTAWFRILENEWPQIKKKLEHFLYSEVKSIDEI